MKAILFNRYGSSADLELVDVPIPQPAANEVLVKIHASSVNDWDWGLLRGRPYINRLLFGMFKPKIKSLGIDISGVVEEVGKQVTSWQTGDAVMADLSTQLWGGFAEYVCVPADVLHAKPSSLSHSEAAALPHSGVLAIQSFLDYRSVGPGDHILINGGGGGSGTLAIQLAKFYGARVTAVDKESKFDLMRVLGADELINYQTTDFTEQGFTYDFILDLYAAHPMSHYARALKPGGTYLMVGGLSKHILELMLTGWFRNLFGNRALQIHIHEPNKYLDQLTEMIEQEGVRPIVGASYSLEDVPKALEHFGQGTSNGKIIIDLQIE